MNVPVKAEGISYKNVPIASHGGGGMLMPQTFGEVVAFSEIMARSQHAIPKHLRDVPGACLAVAMQSMRWEMDPFAVASKSYNVKDIIAYESQLIAAVVHTRAPLRTRPVYTYAGAGQDRQCTVSAMFDDGIERSYESPRIADITTKNSPLWKADPDQQLGYYSVRAFARRYCPEVILGVYTPDEAQSLQGPDNARDVSPRGSTVPFSQRIAEIGGQKTSVRIDDAHVDIASEPTATKSNSSQPHISPDVETDRPAIEESPLPEVAGDQSELSAAPHELGNVEARTGDLGGEAGPQPTLPGGWEITYAAALRRAQKKESLTRYATEYWKQYEGWATHKDGPNGSTAVAIYDAFANNFGNREAIDDVLRELC